MYLRLSNGYRARAALGADLKAVEIPRQWYNLIADLPVKPPPYLHPKTLEPIKPEDLSALFPDELIKQEASTEKFVDIPDEVLDVYSLWRPTPLIRFFLTIIYWFHFLVLGNFLRKPWQEVSYILQLNSEPRGWKSFSTHQPEFITSMKVTALLDHTSPTLQSHKSGIMLSKVLRML